MKRFDFKSLFSIEADSEQETLKNPEMEEVKEEVLEEINEKGQEEVNEFVQEEGLEEVKEIFQEEPSRNEQASEAKAYSRLLKEMDILKEEMLYSNSTVIKAVNDLKQELNDKNSLLDKQEDIIKRQSQTITKFQDDLLYKIQKPLIMELIEISDNIKMILDDEDLAEHKDFSALIDRVKSLYEWVDASLSNNSVKRYSLTLESPDQLDRKRQDVIDIEYTDDPSKDSTFYTERPGYIWSMPYLIINSDIQLKKAMEDPPKSFEFIIRPEEVVKYKFQEKTENN